MHHVSLLALDQTGVRRVRVAWVRGGARGRGWREVGHTTKQPREVIVKLAP